MLYTTLNKILACSPRQDRWEHLLNHLGKTDADDEPLSYASILESNGLTDALWCCGAEDHYDRYWLRFGMACASRVRHLMADPRISAVFDVAERYLSGKATIDDLVDANERAMGEMFDDKDDISAAIVLVVDWRPDWGVLIDASEAAARACTREKLSHPEAQLRSAEWNDTYAAEREWQAQEFLRIVS